MFLTEDEVLMR